MRVMVRIFFYAILITIGFLTHAAAPVINRISPDVPIYPQYFSLIQAKNRIIYVGGTNSILRYDGAHWRVSETRKAGAVRALFQDQSGRIWYGGTNCFGYIQHQVDGSDILIDLSMQFTGEFNGDFADIWNVVEFKGVVYFRGLHDLFAVDAQTGKRKDYWHNANRFGGPFVAHDQLWLQWRGEGLRKFENGEFIAVANTSDYAQSVIINLFELPEHGLFIHDAKPSLSEFRNLTRKSIELPNAEILNQLNDGIKTDPDHFVFGTDDGALILIKLSTREVSRVGIGSTFIPAVISDQDQGLIVLDSKGLAQLEWPPRVLRYMPKDGQLGSIRGFANLGGKLIALSSAGALEASLDQLDSLEQMKPLAWTSEEAWDLLEFDDQLLFAESRELMLIENNQVIKKIGSDNLYPRLLLRDKNQANLIWIGTEHGPALVEFKNNEFKFRGRESDLGWQITSIAQYAGRTWFGSENSGLAFARIEETNEKGFTVERNAFESSFKFENTHLLKIAEVEGRLIASTESGFYQFENESFVPTKLDGLGELMSDGEVVQFISGAAADVWAFSYFSVYRKAADNIWTKVFSGNSNLGAIEALMPFEDGSAFIGGSLEVIQIRTDNKNIADSKSNARISAARIRRQGEASLDLPLDGSAKFHLKGALETEFALSNYKSDSDKKYQFMLEGFSTDWSPWTTRTDAVFYALPAGQYNLRLRAKSASQLMVEAPSFKFVIDPYWYELIWLRYLAIALITATIGAGFIQRQRKRLKGLRQSNTQLDSLVLQRTAELENANHQLRNLAESDGLTGIANRRRFDDFLQSAHQRALNNRSALGLIVIDVDHFKQFNDSNGHQAGDELLKRLSQELTKAVRGDSLAARYGGEEFAIVAPGCDGKAVHEMAERIRLAVQNTLGGPTISLGAIAQEPGQELSAQELLRRADQALYRAKNAGRNKVETAS